MIFIMKNFTGFAGIRNFQYLKRINAHTFQGKISCEYCDLITLEFTNFNYYIV